MILGDIPPQPSSEEIGVFDLIIPNWLLLAIAFSS